MSTDTHTNNTEAKFWIIVREGAQTSAQHKRHFSEESARNEAERLAKKEQAKFYVLALVGSVAPLEIPVAWKDAVPEPEF